jgi:hypothetical protein
MPEDEHDDADKVDRSSVQHDDVPLDNSTSEKEGKKPDGEATTKSDTKADTTSLPNAPRDSSSERTQVGEEAPTMDWVKMRHEAEGMAGQGEVRSVGV